MSTFRLSRCGLLRFSGADALPFLHGQLTCDVQALKLGTCSYGGYCTPKGRLLAFFLLWRDEAGLWMLLPAELADPIRKRLSMYVLRAKVKVEDVSAGWACIGLEGNDAARAEILGGRLPATSMQVTCNGEVRVLSLPPSRHLLVMPGEQAPELPADDARWTRLDIAAGIPEIVAATQEEFVPQMVNLDLIGALSYSKGCYPGQEIVARTHYLGRLKQRMYRARVAAPAAAGGKLYCAELGDQAAGMIVSAVTDGDDSEILAVLQRAQADTAAFRLGAPDGPPLTLIDLPYPVS